MMRLRISRVLIVVGSLLSATTSFDLAKAKEGYWQGDVSTDWNTAQNWFVVGAPGDGSFVPQALSNRIRAIIGTDNPSGALNTTTGNSPLISVALPTAKQTVGGLYLGLRELDYTFNPPQFVNPAPAAGALVGKLTISGGALGTVTTPDSGFGADGRIVVGADGRGFLTMTGGTLTGQQLLVSGENFTGDALGTSLVDLSGTATLAVNNTTTPVDGTAQLDRRLKITGPNAHLTTNGVFTFGSSNSFSAVITSASAPAGPAMIQSGSGVKLGGALNVEFSGAGAIGQTIGNKWNLLSATTGVAGSFNNLGVGNQITVSGLPSAPPTGSAYFVRTVNNGGGKLVQLSYEGVLVLNVNRDTGELKITNPLGGNIAIDSYQVTSPRGSMVASYAGLGSSTPGAGVWTKPIGSGTNSVNGLFEIKTPDAIPPIDHNDAYDLTSVPSVSLGTGFSRTGVAANIANFGIDGEDLTFEYSFPNGGVQRGQIVYQGTKFENDLVLRVNPNTGQAFIKNDSLATLKFDGFSILSSTGDLNGAGFSGLGGSWQTSSPSTANSITQSNLTGSTTLAPGAQLAIGDISSTNFTTAAAQAGLSLQFILSEGLTGGGAPAGDYNGNGVVDAADYVIWRKTNSGTPAAFTTWRANFGATGSVAPPETTFRTGSVVFDTSAGAGAGTGLSSVPEPTSAWLLLAALGAIGTHQRRRRPQRAALGAAVQNSHLRETGAFVMKRQFSPLAAIALLVFTAATNVESAFAVTQGIPLTNGDFELPGPAGTKTIAFDSAGVPLNNIPGWTFPGPGVEDFGHTDHAGGDALGDSGTEGGGNPGNEMLLSTFDGLAHQTSAFNVVAIPATQKYQLTFDAHNIFTVLNTGAPTFTLPQTELTARLYFLAANGTTRTTIGSPLVIDNVDGFANHSIEFVGGSAALTPALGRPIGVEFDVTSNLFNPTWVQHSWIGVDNVLLQIAGVVNGDLDGDGDIDLADYVAVRDHQQQTQLYKAQGELTGDSFVNLNDFRAFRTLYDSAHGSGSLATALAQVPEPSSLALVLLAGAIVTGARRRRFSAATPRIGLLAIAGLVLAAAPASADLLMYDPFLIGSNPAAGQYLADAPLGGQNPILPNNGQYGTTPDFLSGPWVVAGASTHGQSKSAPGLNYIGAPAQGGSIGTVLDTVANSLDTRVGRYFKPGTEWTDSTVGTYYISWLENFGTITNVGDDMGFRSMEFWKTTAGIGDDNLLGDLGYNAYYHPNNLAQRQAATAHMQFQFQPIDGSPVFFQDGATHLIVMKFNLSSTANSDVISIYLDPTSLTEPDLPSLAITGTNVQMAALGMGQFGGFGPNLNTVDELRIATTFPEALPPLPVPGDTDGDRDVDLNDYNNIITHMGLQVGSALLGDVAKGDGTQGSDGRVTIADFRIWKDHYPTAATGSGAAANGNVPEPASWILFSIAAILAAGRGNRRNR